MVDLRERVRGARDYRGVEPKEQTAECAYDGALDDMRVDGHSGSGIPLAILRNVGRMCPIEPDLVRVIHCYLMEMVGLELDWRGFARDTPSVAVARDLLDGTTETPT